MPADHDAARPCNTPVSAEACRPNRTDWNMPPRPISLGRCCSDAFDADGVPRVPTWERRRPRRPNTLHYEEYPVAPADRGSSVGGLTRMQLGKPCRRGRRRSQGCPPTMTVSAPENSRCPPRSVSRTERTGTCNHGPSFSGSSAVTLLMRAGMPADHDAARPGELPVSGPICQPNRTAWNTPQPVRLGKC